MKNRFALIFFAGILICFFVLKITSWLPKSLSQVEINNKIYPVFLADNSLLQYKGWSDKKDMGKAEGMWFKFNKADYHTLVMRKMNFPIDIIWLEQNIVVDMAPEVPTEKGVPEIDLKQYRPRLKATDVLEMKAGFIEENQIKIGDKINLIKQY